MNDTPNDHPPTESLLDAQLRADAAERDAKVLAQRIAHLEETIAQGGRLFGSPTQWEEFRRTLELAKRHALPADLQRFVVAAHAIWWEYDTARAKGATEA